MNLFKLFVPLFVAYNVQSADLGDAHDAISVLKQARNKVHTVVGERYEMDVLKHRNTGFERHFMTYQKSGDSASLSYNFEEIGDGIVKTIVISDSKDGKPDGIPDHYRITEMSLDDYDRMKRNIEYSTGCDVIVSGTPTDRMKKDYNSAIEDLIQKNIRR